MPIDVTELLSPGGAIAQALDGFESRPQQIAMAQAVEQAMSAKHMDGNAGGRLIVEAGTGVGKSFAYLVPAIKRIIEHSERVVVATHTINLQEQLIDKDIPLLRKAIGEKFRAVLVKGRGNYLSLRRLKLASERQDALLADAAQKRSLHALEDWAYSTRDGSLSTLPQLERPEVWDFSQSDSHNCMGRSCPTYEKCFYQSARRQMENGDLLICNHALFFADLALRSYGRGFLPPYDHVILDEAHCVEDVAAEHFGVSITERQIAHLLRLLYQPGKGRGFLATLKVKADADEAVHRAITLTDRVEAASRTFFDSLEHWMDTAGPRNGRIPRPGIIGNNLTPPLKDLATQLRQLKNHASNDPDKFELNSYAQRAADLARETQILIDQQIEGAVYWAENPSDRGRRSRVRRMSLHCMPVDVGPVLREKLFGQSTSIVLTSATLATAPGDFTHLATRLGCDEPAPATTLQLGSPFDHANQVRLYVEHDLPEPNSPRYVAQLSPRIMHHIDATDGGVFVLFTSYKMLEQVADALGPDLDDRGYDMLVHGRDGAPGILLSRFRDSQRGVLFGTVSFWQGVDVRGRALRNVIITRLPFDVPDRPLVEARRELIESRGGNAFMDDQLPRAVIRFRQGFGRLIRASTDTGRVVVLDPRIVTKPYGRLFRAALPDGMEIQAASSSEMAC